MHPTCTIPSNSLPGQAELPPSLNQSPLFQEGLPDEHHPAVILDSFRLAVCATLSNASSASHREKAPVFMPNNWICSWWPFVGHSNGSTLLCAFLLGQEKGY